MRKEDKNLKINITNRIKHLLEPGQSLSEKVVRGGIWVFVLRITSRILRLGRTIILARLLAPSDFGLFGIACLAMETLQTFTQTGFGTALIQKKGKTERYLDTAWTVSIIRGVILFSILFFSAPLVASFFNSPKVILLIRVIAVTLLFGSASNIGIIYFTKELDFRKQFIFQISRTVANIGVAIPLAFILRNTWALVWGMLAGSIVGCIMSYIIHPYRPRLHFESSKAKELLSFGKWVFGSTILIFLITQGDDILVGKLLGVTALGFYTMAYAISNLPATEITHTISQVTFPAYSKLQDNLPKLREAYLKVLKLTTFISFPIAGLIFALAPDFTKLFLGEKWMPMVSAMQVLCIFGVTRSIGATMGPILYSVGKPKIQAKISGIQLFAMAIIIYPLTIRWGILGASLAAVIPNILVLVLLTIKVRNIINATYKEFFMSVIMPVSAVFVMLFALFLKRVLSPSVSSIPNFFLGLVLYSIIYFAIIYLWDRRKGYKMWHEVHEIFSNLGGKSYD